MALRMLEDLVQRVLPIAEDPLDIPAHDTRGHPRSRRQVLGPARISMGSGVTTENCTHPGVSRSRFDVSEKNAKVASSGAGTNVSYVRHVMVRCGLVASDCSQPRRVPAGVPRSACGRRLTLILTTSSRPG